MKDNRIFKGWKRTICTALCIALAVAAYVVPAGAAVRYVEGPNLLENGDFSIGDVCSETIYTTTSIPNWTVHSTADSVCIREDTMGRYAETTVHGSYRSIKQGVALEAGVTYVLEGDFCDAENGAVRYVRINEKNNGLKMEFDERAVWDGNTWNHLKQEFVLTDDCTSLGFYTATINNKDNITAHTLKMKNLSVRRVTMALGNLLANGGFEEPADIPGRATEPGKGWYKNSLAAVNTVFDAEAGNHWVKISDRDTIYRMVRQKANLMAYHTYQLTFRYRLSDMKDGAAAAEFKLNLVKGNKTYSGSSVSLTANADFQKATLTCTAQETGTHEVYLLDSDTTPVAGCVELDDVVLTDITAPDTWDYFEGFETMETVPSGVITSVDGWFAEADSSKNSTRTFVTDIVHTGSRSLKKTGDGNSTNSAIYLKNLPAGRYRASAWCTRNGINTIDFALNIGYKKTPDGTWDNYSTNTVSNPKGNASWKQAVAEADIPYAQLVRFTLQPKWSNTDAWVDDFSLKALSIDWVETDAEAVRYTLQSMEELLAAQNNGLSLPVVSSDVVLPTAGCYDTSITWSGTGVTDQTLSVSDISGWTELTAAVTKGEATDTYTLEVYVPAEGETYGTAAAMQSQTFCRADSTYAGNAARIIVPAAETEGFSGLIIVGQYETVDGAEFLRNVDVLDGSSIVKRGGYLRADVKYENAAYDMKVMVIDSLDELSPLCPSVTVINGQ